MDEVQIASTLPVNKHKKPLPRLYVIGGVALAILLVLIATGVVYVGVKKPYQTTVVRAVICDKGVVDRVNKFYDNETIETDSNQSIVSDIEKLDHFQEDPTCLMIVAEASLHYKSDVDQMKEYAKKLKDFAEKGQYPDSRVGRYLSLDGVQDAAELAGE